MRYTGLTLRNIFAIVILLAYALLPPPAPASEIVKLRAIADIWLSDANEAERNRPMGGENQFKLKSIQEMAAIRFDVSGIRGREVIQARLFLKPAGPHRMHRVRVSTINQDWEEGSAHSLSFSRSQDGATWNRAASDPHKHWAWEGSHFADVIMTSGHSLATWTALREELDGWISIPLTSELVYALITNDSDGLAVVDGGNLAYHNNFFFSHEAGSRGPYLLVELGETLDIAPSIPQVIVEPAPSRAHLNSGALKISIQPAPGVFNWRLRWNNTPIERWRVKHPASSGPTVFYLEDMRPSETGVLHITAIGPSGQASPTARISATTSPSLGTPTELPVFRQPPTKVFAPPQNKRFRVWPVPALIKISPEDPVPLYDDLGTSRHSQQTPGPFDGTSIHLFGARGEYVSFQLCLINLTGAPLHGLSVSTQELHGPQQSIIRLTDIELYKNWYARNADHVWQPAYTVPLRRGEPMTIPDPQRGMATQTNQTVYVDIYIPKVAFPGEYTGAITVSGSGQRSISLPIVLSVYDFSLPDRLSFWTELNTYSVPKNHTQDYFRLAHQHRAVFMPWVIRPDVTGHGKSLTLDFSEYDKLAGPLLSGEAFSRNRRKRVPIRTLYLPFEDSWPTPLTPETYHYTGYWPKRGDSHRHLTDHYLAAPYIGTALSTSYKEGIHAAQRQFIEHFNTRGWSETEMHTFYGGKNTHRVRFGANMWWTTDEPYHWDDWLALQFFLRHWKIGLQSFPQGASTQWLGRADISRPQWQGRILEGLVGPVYFGTGAFHQYRRCRILALETGVDLRSYGSLNPDNTSNLGTVAQLLHTWLHGGRAHLPWQTLGNEASLDQNDNSGGNAILVPGDRFGHHVVGDMRLKAARDGQQLIEYLEHYRSKYNLTREQVRHVLAKRIHYQPHLKRGAGEDNANALTMTGMNAWEVSELRHALAELIVQ